jgi:hypothetical protein
MACLEIFRDSCVAQKCKAAKFSFKIKSETIKPKAIVFFFHEKVFSFIVTQLHRLPTKLPFSVILLITFFIEYRKLIIEKIEETLEN